MKEFVKKGRAVRRQYITALLNGEYSASYHEQLSLSPASQKNFVLLCCDRSKVSNKFCEGLGGADLIQYET